MNKLEALRNFVLEIDTLKQIINHEINHGELFVTVPNTYIKSFLQALKHNDTFPFQTLMDLCANDYTGREQRFEVIYNLLSVTANMRITVKIQLTDGEIVPTISELYRAAGWYEREAWDMYGIYFSDHKDLRRLLTDYGFAGHPMRKDFPLTGFTEMRYDTEKKKVVREKVKLTQNFRNFEFESPWAGTDYILPGDEKATK